MKSIKSLSDEVLVQFVRNKDQELFREIVKRYQDKLLRYASYLVQDESGGADIVQESFIKAFINLHGFNTKKKFSSWIFRIVHNHAINYLKKYKKEVSLENNKWVEQTVKSEENIEDDFEQKKARKMLCLCLKQLPVKYRSVLTLYFFEEKKYEEISDVLRIPVGTVGTQINRGKKMLKTLYQQKVGDVYVKEK